MRLQRLRAFTLGTLDSSGFRQRYLDDSEIASTMMRNDFVQLAFALLATALLVDASAHLVKRQASVAAANETPSAWQYQGCWRYAGEYIYSN